VFAVKVYSMYGDCIESYQCSCRAAKVAGGRRIGAEALVAEMVLDVGEDPGGKPLT